MVVPHLPLNHSDALHSAMKVRVTWSGNDTKSWSSANKIAVICVGPQMGVFPELQLSLSSSDPLVSFLHPPTNSLFHNFPFSLLHYFCIFSHVFFDARKHLSSMWTFLPASSFFFDWGCLCVLGRQSRTKWSWLKDKFLHGFLLDLRGHHLFLVRTCNNVVPPAKRIA